MKRRSPAKDSKLMDIPVPQEYSPAMDADVIQMGQVVDIDDLVRMDNEKSAMAAFELRRMLGAGCVDFARILGILEKKVT